MSTAAGIAQPSVVKATHVLATTTVSLRSAVQMSVYCYYLKRVVLMENWGNTKLALTVVARNVPLSVICAKRDTLAMVTSTASRVRATAVVCVHSRPR